MSAKGSAAWTWRDWAPAWFQAGFAVATLAARAPSVAPALLAAGLLVAVVPRRGPWRNPVWLPYLLTLPFLFAFASEVRDLRDGQGGWSALFRIPAWYFGVLACLQTGSVGRVSKTAQVSWSAMACQILSEPWSGWSAAAGAVQMVLAWALPGDRFHRPIRRPDLRWVPALLLPALALGILWTRGGAIAGALAPRERWNGSIATLKGFSPVSVLGSFADERGDRDDEVAARVWGPPVPFLQGAVFDLYGAGAWRKAGRPRKLESPRMVGEATAFCRDRSDPGPSPDGWIDPVISTSSHVLLPTGTVCAALLADSVDSWPGGTLLARGMDPARGTWWWRGKDSARGSEPADLAVPRGLEGLLDTVLLRAGVEPGADPRGAERALARWFSGEFRYTLMPGLPRGEDPLRRFVRERRGFCEYFATLGVLALRRAGIPARYCVGYAWPDRGPGSSWIFRRRNAHAWVLVLHPGSGWGPWDPTPADDRFPGAPSAPLRWSQDLATRLASFLHLLRDGKWRSRLDVLSDSDDSWSGRAGLAIGLAVFAAATARAAVGIRRKRTESGWATVLSRAESDLARSGHLRGAGETVGAFLERLPEDAPARSVARLRDYQARRFAPGSSPTSAFPPRVRGPRKGDRP